MRDFLEDRASRGSRRGTVLRVRGRENRNVLSHGKIKQRVTFDRSRK